MSLATLHTARGECDSNEPLFFSEDPAPFVAVYDELRRAARGLMRKKAWGERLLDPTGLVNEAIVRLLTDSRMRGHTDQSYVFAAALLAMRRVLVDRARAKKRLKRGGGLVRVPLDEIADQLVERLEDQDVDVEALDRALGRLNEWDPRLAEVVNMRFLLSMTITAIAQHRGCSVSTVENDLFDARAWLRRELVQQAPNSSGPV